MSKNPGWFQRQRKGLWHLRKGGFKQYGRWLQRQVPVETIAKPPQNSVPSVIVSDVDIPVFAGLATMPSRLPVLRDVFNSIYWQVDEVFVFLNNFEEVPEFLQRPRVRVFRSQDYEDYKDVGKFFALRELEQGILFTIDDDILYPPDYVSRMLSYLAATDFKAAVGVHGFQLPRFPKSFVDRYMFHFQHNLGTAALASVLGTGTVAFKIDEVGITFETFTSYGMADIHFAAYLKKMQIPALLVPRPADWLKPLFTSGNDASEEPTLFDQTIRNGAPHNKILRSLSPWGEEDTLARWRSLDDDFPLDESLVKALDAVQRVGLADVNIFNDIPTGLLADHFKSIKPWLDIYADRSTRYRIFMEALGNPAIGTSRRYALDGLKRTDIAMAVEMSRDIVGKNPRDVSALRQHANICSEFYLLEEAEKSFLLAIRLAGTRGSKSTLPILFEYFRMFVRFEMYEKAATVASSLQPGYGKMPMFQALMVIVNLSEGRQSEAEKSLTSLAESDDPRRQRAFDALVRALAESNSKFSASDEQLVSAAAIRVCRGSAEELVALLKIATVRGDKLGSDMIWAILSADFTQYMSAHPEVVWFYSSNWEEATSLLGSTKFGALSAATDTEPFSIHRHISNLGNSEVASEQGPLVSVILTAYNSRETIDFAVQSVLGQTHKDLELIIVDDKSTDGTAELAEVWQHRDSRVTVVRNARNIGPYASRNVAINLAKGSFIGIQDADDVSVPSRLDLQLKSFISDTQAVLGHHVRVDARGVLCLENDGSILGHGPVTLMIKRTAFLELGPFQNVRTRGDKEFESRLEHFYGSHALLRIPEVLVCALHEENTNSRIETSTFDKKRDLMLFKEAYTSAHAEGSLKTTF